ncbi:hypothetical protein ACHAXS_008683 [Conticribra weissflogii]
MCNFSTELVAMKTAVSLRNPTRYMLQVMYAGDTHDGTMHTYIDNMSVVNGSLSQIGTTEKV